MLSSSIVFFSSFQLVISRPGLPVSEVRSAVHVIDGRSEMVQHSRPGSTLSSLLIRNAKPSDSGKYVCNPSNTGPARITVQVLDGKSCGDYMFAFNGQIELAGVV